MIPKIDDGFLKLSETVGLWKSRAGRLEGATYSASLADQIAGAAATPRVNIASTRPMEPAGHGEALRLSRRAMALTFTSKGVTEEGRIKLGSNLPARLAFACTSPRHAVELKK